MGSYTKTHRIVSSDKPYDVSTDSVRTGINQEGVLFFCGMHPLVENVLLPYTSHAKKTRQQTFPAKGAGHTYRLVEER